MGNAEIHNDPRALHRTVAAPFDSVWGVLPAVYAAVGISDAAADPEQRVFGNAELKTRRLGGERLSQYIDCGSGVTAVPKADEYEVTLSVLTWLSGAQQSGGGAGHGTVISTLVTATARPRALSGNPIYCQSTGTLEQRVAEMVLAELGR
ncbi:MAG TPA: hypothetical protein VK573_00785 [Gemmatimonadales bacterium]|nr:hypothetical protein [Gemmatimonadales bacterium]